MFNVVLIQTMMHAWYAHCKDFGRPLFAAGEVAQGSRLRNPSALVCHPESVNTIQIRRKFKPWMAELRDAKVEAASRPLSENT
jgi:hypothetical protein